jgi:hypothetical protein
MTFVAHLLAALCLCGGGGATATGTAVRLNPPPPPPPALPVLFTTESYAGRCTGAEWMLGHFSPGWDPTRMSKIMYRESRCDPSVARSDSGSTGLLQILVSHCAWLSRQMGEPCSQARLRDPAYNVRAAATLWVEQGYGAWSTS